jgi:hypothetical protein
VGEAGGFHDLWDAYRAEPIAAERARRFLDDARAHGLAVTLGVPHGMKVIM